MTEYAGVSAAIQSLLERYLRAGSEDARSAAQEQLLAALGHRASELLQRWPDSACARIAQLAWDRYLKHQLSQGHKTETDTTLPTRAPQVAHNVDRALRMAQLDFAAFVIATRQEEWQWQEAALAVLRRYLVARAKRWVVSFGLVDRLDTAYCEDLAAECIHRLCDRERGGAYDVNRPFAPWANRVIRNLVCDLLERIDAELPADTDFRTEEEEHGRRDPPVFQEDVPFHQDPFAQWQIDLIKTWHPVRDRVYILALYALHRKLPEALWQSWVQETGLPWPFPPPELDVPEFWHGKATAMAEACGITPANAHQIVSRKGRQWLTSLFRESTAPEP